MMYMANKTISTTYKAMDLNEAINRHFSARSARAKFDPKTSQCAGNKDDDNKLLNSSNLSARVCEIKRGVHACAHACVCTKHVFCLHLKNVPLVRGTHGCALGYQQIDLVFPPAPLPGRLACLSVSRLADFFVPNAVVS